MAFSARLLLASFSGLFLAGAAPAQPPAQSPAQPPAQGDNSEIVVTGDRISPDQIRDFVDALAKTPPGTQLSRFERPICPAAVGLPPAMKQALVARMRKVIQALDLRAGDEHCAVNLLVIVTKDKAAFLRDTMKQAPKMFGDLHRSDLLKMIDDPSPAAAWHMNGSVNADGVEMPKGDNGEMSINQTTRRGSRLNLAARPTFTAAAVVIDARALPGLSTTQLADYALMRTLGGADPKRLPSPAPPTILSVLEAAPDAEVPITLTPWDLGFLKGLYGAGTFNAAAQRSEIKREVEKSVGAQKK